MFISKKRHLEAMNMVGDENDVLKDQIYDLEKKLKVYEFHFDANFAWDTADILELQKFLGTPTGRKLVVAFRNLVFQQQYTAMQDKENIEWACGKAAGVASALGIIDVLAASKEQEDSAFEEEEGVLDMLSEIHP